MVISQNAMGKRILIADDSVTIQKAFAMSLTGEDYVLTSARSADEGLSLARQVRPDLIVADAHMPGRSGYELCAALKADATLKSTPVYILSSNQQPYDEAKGRQVGSDGNFLKPWDSTQLLEKIKDALSRPAGAPAPGLAAAPRPTSPIPIAALQAEYDVDLDNAADTKEMPAARPTGPMSIPVAAPAPLVPSRMPTPAPAPAMGGMRPSLIPGVRPGAMPPMRPGATSPARTLGANVPMPSAAVPPRPAPAAQPVGRTLFGLPAASMPFPGSTRTTAPSHPVAHAAPPAAAPLYTPPAAHAYAPPAAPAYVPPARAPEPVTPPPVLARAPAISSTIGSLVDQKVAAFAAKGPEYEALAKLSREVIEQIVWEIVPELAELIIRETVEKRGRA
jgi:CheY-like chemotaxis protein